MEIAILSSSGIKIKGKRATLAIDPQDKSEYEAILLLNKSVNEIVNSNETVVISGHGEYEVGGIKMTGTRIGSDIVYSMHVDGVDILLGNLIALEKMHSKLQEHNIVIANCTEVGSASFITSLAESAVIFYGEKGSEVAMGFGKENVKTMNKYSVTKDKLPTEIETILLQ